LKLFFKIQNQQFGGYLVTEPRTRTETHQKLEPVDIGMYQFWLLLADCLLLGWIGCQPVEAPYVDLLEKE